MRAHGVCGSLAAGMLNHKVENTEGGISALISVFIMQSIASAVGGVGGGVLNLPYLFKS